MVETKEEVISIAIGIEQGAYANISRGGVVRGYVRKGEKGRFQGVTTQCVRTHRTGSEKQTVACETKNPE